MFAVMKKRVGWQIFMPNEVSTLQLRQINTLQNFLTSDLLFKNPRPSSASVLHAKYVIDLKQSLSLWNFANRFMSFLLLMKE